MLAPLIVLAALQAAAPGPPTAAPAEPTVSCTPEGRCTVPDFSIGNGMISNSSSAEAVIVPSSAMPPLPLAVARAPSLGPGRHELVVHWPDAQPGEDYRRSFKTGAACLKARAAVLDEHRARTAAIAVNMANRGTILAMMLDAPTAVCVPLD